MIIDSTFIPAWWLKNPHLQTMHAKLFDRRPLVPLKRERIDLPDGDFLDLDWSVNPRTDAPIVIMLHGLEGNSRSHYIQGLLRAVESLGWQAMVFNFRGCGGEPNRLLKGYHSGETQDLRFVLDTIHARRPQCRIVAVGYSLGGNVLLKYLGETACAAKVDVAVAVSVPLVLQASAQRLEQGCSRLYQAILLKCMKDSFGRKLHAAQQPELRQRLAACRTLTEFDDCVTAPLFGFKNAADYYAQSSSRQFLATIAKPTLIIQARDDPFMTPDVLPSASELAACVRMELSSHGGHVGFVSAQNGWQTAYWLERRIPQFLQEQLNQSIA